LEIGVHALHSGLSIRDYAGAITKSKGDVDRWRHAATIYEACPHMGTDIGDRWRHLSEVHSAPKWLWSASAFLPIPLEPSQGVVAIQCLQAPTFNFAEVDVESFCGERWIDPADISSDVEDKSTSTSDLTGFFPTGQASG
jgi:hypothetical protein